VDRFEFLTVLPISNGAKRQLSPKVEKGTKVEKG
jgi:hypothetical protein